MVYTCQTLAEYVEECMPGSNAGRSLRGERLLPVYSTGPDGRPEMIWKPPPPGAVPFWKDGP
jgi:hypothetical protein